ncbi:MAG: hypothetical protein FJ308_24435, partial [Planctomycetes bacterium]|nr:hypothetical protein [Planctomycetota bacterium]
MNEPASEPLDELLTAYLDGELSASESASVEQKLVSDESIRRRLGELRHAYELLDELPETPHNQSFTQSTIAMVVDDVKRSSPEPSPKPKALSAASSWLAWPYAMVPILAMTLLGSMLGAGGAMLRTRNELSRLALMANLPGMQDVG